MTRTLLALTGVLFLFTGCGPADDAQLPAAAEPAAAEPAAAAQPAESADSAFDRALDADPYSVRAMLGRAAVDLADEGGLDALRMRKLGEKLGVEAMSLYNHVAGK